ncbi:hypothetical protein BDR05DRAFT_891245, partial [Suillus weaverae]
SQYEIYKLKSFEYVELCFMKVDNFVALKTVASLRPSHKVIQDHGLEWCQFDMVKNSFLVYINKLNWPEKHQCALTMFFMNIVSHLQWAEPFGKCALLLYAACIQCD